MAKAPTGQESNMVIGYLIIGMGSGALMAGIGLIAGSSLWSAFLLYSLGGSLTTLGMAALVYVLPRKSSASSASSNSIVSATPKSTNA